MHCEQLRCEPNETEWPGWSPWSLVYSSLISSGVVDEITHRRIAPKSELKIRAQTTLASNLRLTLFSFSKPYLLTFFPLSISLYFSHCLSLCPPNQRGRGRFIHREPLREWKPAGWIVVRKRGQRIPSVLKSDQGWGRTRFDISA